MSTEYFFSAASTVFCRCIISTDSQPDSEILRPVSLTLLVQRNLAAAWYRKTPTISIKGDLKPMQVISWQIRATSKVTYILRNSTQPS